MAKIDEQQKKMDAASATAEATADAAPQPQSQREIYQQRTKWNADDEEGSYKAANSRLDELDALNAGVDNLRGVMDTNPFFAQWIVEAKKNKDFNPILFGIENGYLDIEALKDDPEYAKKIAEAQQTWLAKQAKDKEADDLMAKNLPASIDACMKKGEELGMSKEQCTNVIGKVFDMLDGIDKGEIPVDVFELLAKGENYDNDVAQAEAQGAAQGRATKVRETLKSMPTKASRASGAQPAAPVETGKGGSSMFGL